MTRAAWEIWSVFAGLIAGVLCAVAGVTLLRSDGDLGAGLGWLAIGIGVFAAASLLLHALAPNDKGPPAPH